MKENLKKKKFHSLITKENSRCQNEEQKVIKEEEKNEEKKKKKSEYWFEC
jgi:hypothetical protein